ncbi:uridine kinase [Streptomyces sp. SM14]|uniref:uridine kinase family protein n=1 Tax=Streptomyces sp. SM14 TaxID=1736045 RepID=UPI000CD5A4DD|nr:hypothetical protein [Streptomyces sp. SM14]
MSHSPGGAGTESVARRALSATPALGPVRLVGIDGHAGSGKSTFAGRLSSALGGAPVVRLDDLAEHDALFDWAGLLERRVLGPLRQGRQARFPAYDWVRRARGPERVVPPAPVVLLEGVGAGRRSVRPSLSLLVWLDVDREAAWRRGRERDGPEQAGFWDGWERAEAAHFADDPSLPHADLLLVPGDGGYTTRVPRPGAR